MRRYSKTTASRAIIACELLLLSAACVRAPRGEVAKADAPKVHSEQPAEDGAEEGDEAPAPSVSAAVPPKISASVVSLSVATQNYDFTSPWAKQRPSTGWTTGLIVEGKRILVTGGSMGNRTLVQVQKDGQPKRYTAKVELVDYEIPLALLSVEDETFWAGLEPLPIADLLPREGNVTIYRWLSSGQLEDAPGKIRQIRASDHWPGRANVLTLDITTQMTGAGWSEIVVAGGRVIGLSTSKSENQLAAIGGPVLRGFIENAKTKPYCGISRGGYVWQRLTNPALRKFLGLEKIEGGVMVTKVLPHGTMAGLLKPGDVLLSINGNELDSTGQFQHPMYGRLPSAVILTDGLRPGDAVELDLFRAGKRSKVRGTLKRISGDDDRIPPYVYDAQPDYLVAGGLLFQHLTRPYLQTWREWWKRAPLRLLIAHDEDAGNPTPEEPRVVVLTKVLADPVNLGYQDLGPMIVRAVNGKPARTLEDVRAALAKPVDGFQVIEFLPGQGPRRIVLDAAEAAAAEARIRESYGIE